MRAFAIPAAAVAILSASTFAFAADTVTSGTIKAFDMNAGTLTLNDGTVYALPGGFKDPGLKNGEKVKVSWKMENTKHMADKVEVVK
jgi:Cu/Ag efflux protein CusF